MDYKGHIIAGTVFLIGVLLLDYFYIHFFFNDIDFTNLLTINNLKLFFLYTPLVGFSFLSPDIDTPASKPKLIITLLLLSITLYFLFTQLYTLAIISTIILILVWCMGFIPGFQHRGHTHSLIFIALISGLVFLLNWRVGILFFIGAFSHLLFDLEFKLW